MELFYKKPAAQWTEALPIGNGRLGAMVWGDPRREEIQLNEETLWDGRFDPEADNPETPEHLGEIREAIFSGDLPRFSSVSVTNAPGDRASGATGAGASTAPRTLRNSPLLPGSTVTSLPESI